MKRVMMCAVAVVVVAWAVTSFAGVKWTKDLADNDNMNYVENVCPRNTTAVGIGYVDKSLDKVDAYTVVCRDRKGREFPVMNRDFDNTSKALLTLTCKPGWKWVGLYIQDKKNSDASDAASPICKRGGREEVVYNRDLNQNLQGLTLMIDRYEQIVGVAYKDLRNSDYADGPTVIVK